MINTKLLRKVQKAILANPTQVNMDDWFSCRNTIDVKVKRCGATGCIAGWAIALDKDMDLNSASDLNSARSWSYYVPEDYLTLGKKALGLTEKAASRLFFEADWPHEFGIRLHKAKTQKQYAKVVADRIEFFLKHKK